MLDRPLSATTSGSTIRVPSIDPAKSLVVDEIMILPASVIAATLAALSTSKSEQITFSAYERICAGMGRSNGSGVRNVPRATIPVEDLIQRGDNGVRERSMSFDRKKQARLPPRWFVRLAWSTHRVLYGVTGGRAGL